jgi:hypothetical protein
MESGHIKVRKQYDSICEYRLESTSVYLQISTNSKFESKYYRIERRTHPRMPTGPTFYEFASHMSEILLLTLSYNSVFPFLFLTKLKICYDRIVYVLVLWETHLFFSDIPSIYLPYEEYHFLAAVDLLCRWLLYNKYTESSKYQTKNCYLLRY